jgi:hypothetical protein
MSITAHDLRDMNRSHRQYLTPGIAPHLEIAPKSPAPPAVTQFPGRILIIPCPAFEGTRLTLAGRLEGSLSWLNERYI